MCFQGLWQVRDFEPGNMALVPEFLCVISGVVNQIGDIAVMQRGDIAVSVTHMCTIARCAS